MGRQGAKEKGNLHEVKSQGLERFPNLNTPCTPTSMGNGDKPGDMERHASRGSDEGGSELTGNPHAHPPDGSSSEASPLLRSFLSAHLTVITPALPAHVRGLSHEEIAKKFSKQFPVLRYAVQRGLPVIPVDHPKSFGKSKLLKELLKPSLPSRWALQNWNPSAGVVEPCVASTVNGTAGAPPPPNAPSVGVRLCSDPLSSTSSGLPLHQLFDVSVVVSFRYFLPRRLLQALPSPVLNVHPSLLPRFRGASPIFSTLLKRHLQEEEHHAKKAMKTTQEDQYGNLFRPMEEVATPSADARRRPSCLFSHATRGGVGGVTIIELHPDQPIMDGGRMVWQRSIPLDKKWTDLRTYFPLVAQLGAAGCCELIFGSGMEEKFAPHVERNAGEERHEKNGSHSHHLLSPTPLWKSACGMPFATSDAEPLQAKKATRDEETLRMDSVVTPIVPTSQMNRYYHDRPNDEEKKKEEWKSTRAMQLNTESMFGEVSKRSEGVGEKSTGSAAGQTPLPAMDDADPSSMALCSSSLSSSTSITEELIQRAASYYVDLLRYHACRIHHIHTWVHEVHTALHHFYPSSSTLHKEDPFAALPHRTAAMRESDGTLCAAAPLVPHPAYSWQHLYPQAVCASSCDWPKTLHAAITSATPQAYPTFSHFTQDPFHAPILPRDAALLVFERLTGREAFSAWSAFVGGAGMFSTVQTMLQKPYCPAGVMDVLRRLRRHVRVARKEKLPHPKYQRAAHDDQKKKENIETGERIAWPEMFAPIYGVPRSRGNDSRIEEARELCQVLSGTMSSSSLLASHVTLAQQTSSSSVQHLFAAVLQEEGKKAGGGGLFQTCSFTEAVHPDLVSKQVLEELALVEQAALFLSNTPPDPFHHPILSFATPSSTSSSFSWKVESGDPRRSRSTTEPAQPSSTSSSASSSSPTVVTFYFGGWHGSVGSTPKEGRVLSLHPFPILQREQQRWAAGGLAQEEEYRILHHESTSPSPALGTKHEEMGRVEKAVEHQQDGSLPRTKNTKEISTEEPAAVKTEEDDSGSRVSLFSFPLKEGYERTSEKKEIEVQESEQKEGHVCPATEQRAEKGFHASHWNQPSVCPYVCCTVKDFIHHVQGDNDEGREASKGISSLSSLAWLVPGSVYFPHGDPSLGAIRCREGWFFWKAAHFAGAPTSTQPANLLRKGLAMRCGTVYTHVFSSFSHSHEASPTTSSH